jgi:hypothetical protein
MSEKGMFVFQTHQQVWDHNKIKLLNINQSYPIAKLSAIGKGVHANSMKSDRADGLQKLFFYAKCKSHVDNKSQCSFWFV